MSRVMRKPFFAYAKLKTQITCAVTAQLISPFLFCYIDSIISLLSKSEISGLLSRLLWPYSPVCVGPGRKPRRQVLS